MSSTSQGSSTRPKAQWTGERGKLRVATEVIYCGAFYALYTMIRNTQGSNRGSKQQAFTNAKRIIRWEKALSMYFERRAQTAFLDAKWLFQFLNTWYGTAHFIVTFAAFAWCFVRRPQRYRRVRNTIGVMTALALIGFAFFPLMPPRLLPASYGYVDSLKTFGGPWSFESGPVARVSNQYAAMPSLHFGWSTWCTYTLWPWAMTARSKAGQWFRGALLVLYPAVTLFAIVVTANHYVLDAAGGVVVFVIGLWVGKWIDRAAVIDRVRLRAPVDAGQ
jgi:PAP2 superfamily